MVTTKNHGCYRRKGEMMPEQITKKSEEIEARKLDCTMLGMCDVGGITCDQLAIATRLERERCLAAVEAAMVHWKKMVDLWDEETANALIIDVETRIKSGWEAEK